MTRSCRLFSVGALLALLVYASVAGDAAVRPDREATEAPLAGRLLVAAPDLDDPNFSERWCTWCTRTGPAPWVS